MVLVLLVMQPVFLLVFHLEHDRDDLVSVFILLAVDVVALGAAAAVVVLLEIRVAKRRSTQLVERDLAVLFERFAQEFGVQTHAHVAHPLDFALAVCDDLVFRAELFVELPGVLGLHALGIELVALDLRCKLVTLALDFPLLGLQLFGSALHGKLELHICRLLLSLEHGLELCYARVLGR